jgi:hypothetical protein
MNDRIIILQDKPRGPSELVEVVFTVAGEQKKKFPDISQLRSTPNQKIVVTAIRLITPDVLVAPMLSQTVTAPITELQKMAVVLYCNGWEKGHYIPILTLNDMTVPGGTAPHRYAQTNFEGFENISWDLSYIQFGAGQNVVNPPYTVLFDVQYVKFNSRNELIEGAT